MIYIVAKNIIKEGKKADFIKAAQELIAGSKAEAGNIAYDLYQDLENENVLTFIEQWKDEAAIAFHNETEHFKKGVASIHEFTEGGEVTKYKLA